MCNHKNKVFQQLSGEKLCKVCFNQYFEKKVIKTISKFKLIEKDDKICVALSGGKDSLTILNILNKLSLRRKNFSIEALLIDEGIKGYRDITIKIAKDFCNKNNIKLHIYSFKEEFGKTLDQITKKQKNPCSACGIFRRKLLNLKSRKLGFTKLATGHNLDDEAQAILMNQFKNNMSMSARLGPMTGIKKQNGFVRRIKPLYLCTEKEVMIYSFLNNLKADMKECTYVKDSFRKDVRDRLNDLEDLHPGSKQGVVNSYLDIKDLLKKYYKSDKKINVCSDCGELCSGKICNACKLEKKIN